MSFLSADEIRDLIMQEDLISCPGADSDEWGARLAFIEGSAFDLTIEKLFFTESSPIPFITTEDRKTAHLHELTAKQDPNFGDLHMLKLFGGGYYLFQTAETLNLPDNLVGVLRPRTSMIRSGAIVQVSDVAPGFQGKITGGIYMPDPHDMFLEVGARIITCRFATLGSGVTDTYAGIWGGDKVTTDGVERAH